MPLLHLVVGYDGSPPASRALDAAVLLLRGRTGRIAVVYVAHLSGIVIEAPVAAAETEPGFDEIEQELRTQAATQLRDREVPWEFERRQGNIAEELFLSVDTVKSTLGRLFELFGLESLPQNQKRAALAAEALARGIVRPVC